MIMACGSCGTKPGGCKSNGGCSTGGCNRFNTHDWLRNLPVEGPDSSCNIIEVSFAHGSRKEFYRNSTLHLFEKGDYVTVEGVGGFDVGEVSLTGEIVRLQLKRKGVREEDSEIKKVLRRSNDMEVSKLRENKAREKEALMRSRAIARQIGLEMKLVELEIQADGKKATFFYTADDRVDFRELIKIYAGEFKVKVEMRQIGSRQEAGKVGGIGSCGRELCCSTWLTDFKSVNTTVARYQNLSINQTKLSGQCGRLKCCLNFELDTYLDALQHFPDNAEQLQLERGTAFLVKKDIFRNLMWYVLSDSNKQYPLTLDRVMEIKRMNAQGVKAEELQPVEVVSSKPKEVEPEFVDVVGQISLRSLERNTKRRNDQRRQQQRQQPGDSRQRGSQQQQQQGAGGQRNPQQQQGGGNRNQQRPPQRNAQNQGPKRDGNAPKTGGGQGQQQRPQRPSNNRPPQQPRPPQNPTA
jgi:cell fate regulator YaaT (PSP1 superfamily)